MSTINLKKNAFDLLRYISAFAVMLHHYTGAFSIFCPEAKSGAAVYSFNSFINDVGIWYHPVVILFTISGFLIPISFEHSGSREEFLKKRLLRIYPPIWLMVILNSAMIVLFRTDVLKVRGFWIWILVQTAGIAYTPRCLRDFATGSTNGAFWSISVLIQFYIAFAIFFPFLRKLRFKGWTVLFAISAVINLVCGYSVQSPAGASLDKILQRTVIPYAFYFLAGVFMYEFRESIIPFLKRYLPAMIILYVPYRMFSPVQIGYYCDLVRAAFTSATAATAAFVLPSVRYKRDFSYELFLYHWPVLNFLVQKNFIQPDSWTIGLLLFLLITVAVSFLSNALIRMIINRMV